VFESPVKTLAVLHKKIESYLKDKIGYEVTVVIRSADILLKSY
jgi:uncharacterized protein (DUF1697 family)